MLCYPVLVQGPEPTRKGTGEVAAPTNGPTPADQNSPAQTPDPPQRAAPPHEAAEHAEPGRRRPERARPRRDADHSRTAARRQLTAGSLVTRCA